MLCWTFFVLVGNGKRLIVDQVRAGDLRSAYLQWAQVIDIEGITLTPEGRATAWGLDRVAELEYEFGCRPDLKAVWCSICTFDLSDEDRPEEWGGRFPAAWVIKTDIGHPGLDE